MLAILVSLAGVYIFLGCFISLIVYLYSDPIPKANNALIQIWIALFWPRYIKGFVKAYIGADEEN